MYRKYALKHGANFLQFSKYFIVGGVAFIFDFSVLFVLTEYYAVSYLTSAAVGFIVGLNVNYFLAKYFVFKESKIKNQKKEYMLVAAVSFFGLALNQGLIWGLTELLGVYYLFSKIISTVIIFVYNFIVRKIYIFT